MKKNTLPPFALRTATLVTALSLALLAACSEKTSGNGTAAHQPNAAAASAAPSDEPKAQGAQTQAESDTTSPKAAGKMQAYIACYNTANDSAQRSIARYASWVDAKKGPTGKERHVYGLYQIHEHIVQACQKKIEAALQQQPALEPLDGAARSYLQALSALAPLVDEAYKYYERENYKDDGFTKGKQMHAPLVQAMQAFDAASQSFASALETENDKLLAEELKQIEKTEGRKLLYWHMLTMAEAKQLANLLSEDTFDMNQATAQLAEFEQAADELAAYAKAHKNELPTAWSFMDSAVENFRIAAKERIRRIRDKKPYSQTERNWVGTSSGWMVNGSPDKLVRQYNELVSRSNSIH